MGVRAPPVFVVFTNSGQSYQHTPVGYLAVLNNAHERMKRETRRGRFIAPTADLSALGGGSDVPLILFISVITLCIHTCVDEQQRVKAFLIVWYYTVVVYHVTQQQNKVFFFPFQHLYMQHINQPECDHQE